MNTTTKKEDTKSKSNSNQKPKQKSKNKKSKLSVNNMQLLAIVVLSVIVLGQGWYIFSSKPANGYSGNFTKLFKNSNNSRNIDDWPNRPFDAETWEPFQEISEMQQHMNRVFNDTINRFQNSANFNNLFTGAQFDNNLMIKEVQDKFIVTMPLPNNFDKDASDIKVDLKDSLLTINGSVDYSNNKSNSAQKYTSNFTRAITLPTKVDDQSLVIDNNNNILVLTILKLQQPIEEPKTQTDNK